MPYFHIRTNHTVEDPTTLLGECSRVIADALGKSEKFVMTAIDQRQPMTFAGSSAPCALVSLTSIGLPSAQTGELSASITQLLVDRMELDGERIYIDFRNAERAFWGWNGSTFER